ncbi:MAG: GIY-YIG nuclease family protein [Patescibacteria group bacterium]
MYYYVYILRSEKSGKLYKGRTADLRNRLLEHNRGENKSTKNGKPWRLIYYEAFASKTDALREERFLKSGKGRERISYLLKSQLDKFGGVA